LATVQAVISELAAIVASARAALGAERSGNQLEMAEMDLLSAQASIEKACMEIDLAPSSAGDVLRFIRPAVPGRVLDADAVEQPTAPRRVRRPGRRAPGQGQCELFSLPVAL
jgi:hypothetical protein